MWMLGGWLVRMVVGVFAWWLVGMVDGWDGW